MWDLLFTVDGLQYIFSLSLLLLSMSLIFFVSCSLSHSLFLFLSACKSIKVDCYMSRRIAALSIITFAMWFNVYQ